ncbi:MAG: ParB/RepB/Spo0J family partition protein [Oscillospiraceae bacterium]|jgi:ParB family chromosome partitioning protein
MAATPAKNCFESDSVVYININEIVPNPAQPRKVFDLRGLEELAISIARHGILQPISVRRTSLGYELVAGERRLRASKLAGLTSVPCIVLDVDGIQSGLLALIENLQRRDLDCFEEAEGLAKLMRISGWSQDEAAKKLGKSQSSVANKLRLLRLSPEVVSKIRQYQLTERHARALLRLQTDEERLAVLVEVIRSDMNVAKTESFIDSFLIRHEGRSLSEDRKRIFVMKDVRLFINSVNKGLDLMRHSGINAQMARRETEKEITLTITIPK